MEGSFKPFSEKNRKIPPPITDIPGCRMGKKCYIIICTDLSYYTSRHPAVLQSKKKGDAVSEKFGKDSSKMAKYVRFKDAAGTVCFGRVEGEEVQLLDGCIFAGTLRETGKTVRLASINTYLTPVPIPNVLAIGANYLLVDIPTGTGTKVPTIEDARVYARDMMDLGEKLGIHTECAITYADQPVGNAVGPNLEARECIAILEGAKHPASVIEKACDCAGIILDMAGIPGGAAKARELLESGAAHRKFMEIVVAQGGNPELKSEDLKPGQFSEDIVASMSG